MGAFPPLLPTQGRLSSRYGMRRGRISGNPTYHAGLDFDAGRGTPVYAVADGVIHDIARDSTPRGPYAGYGNAVVLYHPDDERWSFYAHLDSISVREGQRVRAADRIGRVGNTSNGRFRGMGRHLHFEIRKRTRDGRPPFPGPYRWNNVDPEEYLNAKGVTFGDRGEILVVPATEAFATTVRFVERAKERAGVSGLGMATPGNPNIYEPPVPDADLVGTAGGLMVMGALAASLVLLGYVAFRGR